MNWKTITTLSTAVMAIVATWLLPWLSEGNPEVCSISKWLGVAAILLSWLAYKLFAQGTGKVAAVVFVVIAGLGIVMAPAPTDWDASFNHAARAARVVMKLVKENDGYAHLHGGSFAARIEDLGIEHSNGQYTILYNPAVEPDRMIRHYTVRALAKDSSWRTFYADETRVVRFSDTTLADRNSQPL